MLIGDRVQVIDGQRYEYLNEGDTGTIVCDADSDFCVGVEFDKENKNFHMCNGQAKNLHGYYVRKDAIRIYDGLEQLGFEYVIDNGDIFLKRDNESVSIYNDNTVFINNFNFEKWSENDWISLYKIIESKIKINNKILDEEEKKYLSCIIKPFKNRVERIAKIESTQNNNEAFISIYLFKDEQINLPYFKKDKMYKNMKINARYTLEQLGL